VDQRRRTDEVSGDRFERKTVDPPTRQSRWERLWSGQAAWVPMGSFDVGDLGPEDPTSHPAPGELLLYPGGLSEVEILFPYGDTCFASKAGQLAGNHFATVVDGLEHLPAIGELVLWQGAQDISFAVA
jgi:hypothetical protein